MSPGGIELARLLRVVGRDDDVRFGPNAQRHLRQGAVRCESQGRGLVGGGEQELLGVWGELESIGRFGKFCKTNFKSMVVGLLLVKNSFCWGF